jgi:hypothetical protein
VFVCVDDILLALSHRRAKNAIEEITEFNKAKEGSVKPPAEIYLGANIISKVQLPDG